MSQPSPSMVRALRIARDLIPLFGAFALLAFSSAAMAMADRAAREQDIVNLRLGQRILVEDGSCPAGQIKEISGAKMTAGGVLRARKCIPRGGPKQKVDTSRKF